MCNRLPSCQRPTVPIEYGGKWIAWAQDQSEIIAEGSTFAEARAAAIGAGEPRPRLEKVPRSDAWHMGTR